MVTMNQGLAAGGLATAFVAGKALKSSGGAAPFIEAYIPGGIGSRVYVAPRQGLDGAAQGRGSPLMPYATFDAAVAAIGKPTTIAQYEGGHTIDLAAGDYDVSKIVLPMGRWQILLRGGARLIGNLRMELDLPLRFGSPLVPSITIKNTDGYDGILPAATTFRQSAIGTLTLTQAVGTVATPETTAMIHLESVQLTTIVAPATLTGLLGVTLRRTTVTDPMSLPTAVIAAWDTYWLNTIVCAQLDNVGGTLNNNITVSQVSTFISSRFSVTPHVFTGTAVGQLVVDGNSNYRWKVGPWTLVVTTKVVASDNTA